MGKAFPIALSCNSVKLPCVFTNSSACSAGSVPRNRLAASPDQLTTPRPSFSPVCLRCSQRRPLRGYPIRRSQSARRGSYQSSSQPLQVASATLLMCSPVKTAGFARMRSAATRRFPSIAMYRSEPSFANDQKPVDRTHALDGDARRANSFSPDHPTPEAHCVGFSASPILGFVSSNNCSMRRPRAMTLARVSFRHSPLLLDCG